MNNFWEGSKFFWGIIIGAVIIGGCVYFVLKSEKVEPQTPQLLVKTGGTSDVPPTLNSRNFVKSDITPTASCGAAGNTIVTKVIDGDTVVAEGGWHVRLLGMDADEKGYPCYESAKIRLEELVLGKQVVLEKDKTDLDQYGRCLRYIFVNNINVDVQLVKEGLAVQDFIMM